MNKRKLTIKEIADSRGKTPAYIAKNKFGNYVKDRRIEAVENYDVACSEDFEGWVLHHRKEAEKTAKELLADKEYFYALPEDMIWLRIEDHEKIHEEINKLPWRQEMEAERHRRMKRKNNITWTEEMREAHSVMQKAKWTDERKKRHTELCAKRRENGENTVNVSQLDGREGYREYQRQYRKIHYARHKEEWKDYLMQKSYEGRTTEELLRLLDKKKRSVALPEDRKNRLINMIKKELNKRDDYKTPRNTKKASTQKVSTTSESRSMSSTEDSSRSLPEIDVRTGKFMFFHKEEKAAPGFTLVDNTKNAELDHRLYSEWAGIDLLCRQFDRNEELKKQETDVEKVAIYDNPEWVTFSHYRRIPDPDCTKRIYVAAPVKLGCTLAQHYGSCHFIEDLVTCGKAMKECYPNMVPAFEKTLNSNLIIPYNIVVAPYGQIRDWCSFVLKVLKKTHEMGGNHTYEETKEIISRRKVPEFEGRNNDIEYQCRYLSFLSERISTCYWLTCASRAQVFPMNIFKSEGAW